MKFAPLIAIAAAAAALSAPTAAQSVVPLPRFDTVALQGGGQVILRHGDRQKVTIVSGDPSVTSFSVDGQSLRIEACDKRCPANYDLVVEIVTPQVSAIAVDGGGMVEAQSGFPDRNSLALAINGGGVIDAQKVGARQVSASVTGGGVIKAGANRSLAASVRGGGLVTYLGDPAVATSVVGGGLVRRADDR